LDAASFSCNAARYEAIFRDFREFKRLIGAISAILQAMARHPPHASIFQLD